VRIQKIACGSSAFSELASMCDATFSQRNSKKELWPLSRHFSGLRCRQDKPDPKPILIFYRNFIIFASLP
jgi:hypothetical protein